MPAFGMAQYSFKLHNFFLEPIQAQISSKKKEKKTMKHKLFTVGPRVLSTNLNRMFSLETEIEHDYYTDD
jgi:hypothetical protein